MKTINLLLTILLFSWSLSFSQSISVSPYSIRAWGQTPDMGSISVEYKNIGIHYFHAYESYNLGDVENEKVVIDGGWTQSSWAVSWIPIDIKEVIRFGGLYAVNKFPTDKSNHFNFWLEAGYNFGHIRLSYVHISNGLGVLNEVNPGLDHIRITFQF